MIIDTLNLNHLRIFESVYRTKSMTKAAEELNMTQSGVSQHIKLLEEMLDFQLFDRIKQRLVPTGKAIELFSSCSKNLYSIEKTLAKIMGKEEALSGKVVIGVPIEFGNSLILPHIANFGSQHPNVLFRIFYGFASEMNTLLLEGKIDFAFVDSYSMDPLIQTKKTYDEEFVLCASQEYIEKKGLKEDKDYFESLDYISYMEETPILKMWFKHHYRFKNIDLKLRATLMDVQGVGQLIGNNLGVGILPRHRIKKEIKMGKSLHTFKGSGKPLMNTISLAYVRNRTFGPLHKAMLEIFDNLNEGKS